MSTTLAVAEGSSQRCLRRRRTGLPSTPTRSAPRPAHQTGLASGRPDGHRLASASLRFTAASARRTAWSGSPPPAPDHGDPGEIVLFYVDGDRLPPAWRRR